MNENERILVIGGCKSGKSNHALKLATRHMGNKNYFVATCIPKDDEMQKRVSCHQKERSDKFITVEVPFDLEAFIDTKGSDANVILVDCLTLWTTNLLLEELSSDEMIDRAVRLANSIRYANCPVIVVSNEVGQGIVPERELSRAFRDLAGRINQIVAESCTKVFWMVAGIPVPIKEDKH